MHLRLTSLGIVFGAVLGVSTVASAGFPVPNPAACTIDPCINVCPAGDMTFHTVIRDYASNPIAGSAVTLDFCACPGIFLCPSGGGGGGLQAVTACTVTMFTNALGVADFNIRAGGVCSGGPVTIVADVFPIAQRNAVASPDQNGDAVVNATDQAILAAKLAGPFDPTGDLNCNAALEAGDLAIQTAHLGHACGAVVPVTPGSWGRMKIIYR